MSPYHKGFEGLYLHIPFCSPKKCKYCSFYSLPHDFEQEYRFLDALKIEMGLVAAGVSPETVFIGGGTPSALSETGLRMLFDILGLFDLLGVKEFTCEANPNSLSPDKLKILAEGGVNRVSIGAQSFSEDALKVLGRCHEPRDVITAAEHSRNYGIDNISLDLISDVPGTSRDEWRADLQTASALNVAHLSVYCLSIEKGTGLCERVARGELEPVGDEESALRMELTRNLLAEKGFEWYEISNYARQRRYSKHNSIYWRNGRYLGLGPSAVSYDGSERRRNVSDLSGYCEALRNRKLPVVQRERLSIKRKAGETAMLMLRRRRGVDRSEFLDACGLDFETEFCETVSDLIGKGLLERHEGNIRIPADKAALSDAISAYFMEA
ncbi:MAG: radical SAM family heme chaperone HemW [Planctomycetota bacterium]|nr:radical SAM family heme chaperone HemW [Planctomycetota bacterium]